MPRFEMQRSQLPNKIPPVSDRVVPAALYTNVDGAWFKQRQMIISHLQRKPRSLSTKAPIFSELPQARHSYVHLRGDYKRPGELASPKLLDSLCASQSKGEPVDRLDLARGWSTLQIRYRHESQSITGGAVCLDAELSVLPTTLAHVAVLRPHPQLSRLAGDRVDSKWLESQANNPPDRNVGYLLSDFTYR